MTVHLVKSTQYTGYTIICPDVQKGWNIYTNDTNIDILDLLEYGWDLNNFTNDYTIIATYTSETHPEYFI